MDWSEYPNFTKQEFDCKETGENQMLPEFLTILQAIRTEYNRPMRITSGYRSKKHSIEIRKNNPGEHTYGCAVDIAVWGIDALHLIEVALKHGIRRIGISQKEGAARFVHLGIGDKLFSFPEAIWSY